MKNRYLKISLKNLTSSEVSETEAQHPTQTHLAQPDTPALLFSDGTSVRITKDAEGNLMLHLSEPEK